MTAEKRRKKKVWTIKQIRSAFRKWKNQKSNKMWYDIEYFLEEEL